MATFPAALRSGELASGRAMLHIAAMWGSEAMAADWVEWWPYVVAVLGIAIGVPAAIHAAMTKDDVRAAIAWVGVILLSPLLGALLYLVAGINRIRRTSISVRRMRADLMTGMVDSREPETMPAEPRFASLKRLGDNISPFPLTGGNAIETLEGGDEAYPAMLRAIEGAGRHVALASYIFDNDPVGRQFVDALAAARRRGVAVRVLVDAVGARYSRPSIVGPLREAGIPIELFLGNIIGFRLPYANLRIHRKIMIVDGAIGFTGGMNIRRQFSSAHAEGKVARDTHFALRGPVVGQLLATFVDDWFFTCGERLESDVWRAEGGPAGDRRARAIVSGPDLRVPATHTMILGALAVAEESIRICSPYFLPDQQLIGALGVAARRGVAVDVVVPEDNNLRLVDFAMTAQLDQLVAAGCRIWRSPGAFDHSKLMVVDGKWALIGSSNLDTRSLRLNFEIDLEVFDDDFARALGGLVQRRIEAGWQETLETLRARPFPQRLRNRIVWLASPYL